MLKFQVFPGFQVKWQPCFNKKNFMTKKSYLYDKLFVSNENFTTENVKIIKNSRFFSKFLKFQDFPGYLCLNCRTLGKVATLLAG